MNNETYELCLSRIVPKKRVTVNRMKRSVRKYSNFTPISLMTNLPFLIARYIAVVYDAAVENHYQRTY